MQLKFMNMKKDGKIIFNLSYQNTLIFVSIYFISRNKSQVLAKISYIFPECPVNEGAL